MANLHRNEVGGAARSGNPALASGWLDPDRRANTAALVRAAVAGAARLEDAARELGIGLRTLKRWIASHPELAGLRCGGGQAA